MGITPFMTTTTTLTSLSNYLYIAPSDQLESHRSMFSTRKRCLIGIPIRGYQNFYSLAQKRPNLAQNWHLGPNIGIFGPFYLRPDQITMRTSCVCGFLLCWYQNFYLLP